MEVTDSMKQANGYGSITKQTDKPRRRPYVVRVTEGWKEENGKYIQKRRVLGSFRTQAEARQALADYHANPLVFQQDATFAEVYEKWSAKKYPDLSESAQRAYKAAFSHSDKLHSLKMRDIQAVALQSVMDADGHSYDTKRFMAQLYRAMFNFAIANQLVQTGLNPADYLALGKKEEKKNPHQRFSKDDIEAMWQHSNDPNVQVVLILIYTGLRPGELVDLKKENVHEDWIYIDHGKTENAVRKVPLHWAIVPFVQELMKVPGDYLVQQADGSSFTFDLETNRHKFRRRIWEPALKVAGCLEDDNGKKHRAHDCRHTFTSLWKGQKLDEAMRRKIQGHSGKGVGEQIYMLPDLEDLKDEIDQLWTPKVLATGWLPCGT